MSKLAASQKVDWYLRTDNILCLLAIANSQVLRVHCDGEAHSHVLHHFAVNTTLDGVQLKNRRNSWVIFYTYKMCSCSVKTTSEDSFIVYLLTGRPGLITEPVYPPRFQSFRNTSSLRFITCIIENGNREGLVVEKSSETGLFKTGRRLWKLNKQTISRRSE